MKRLWVRGLSSSKYVFEVNEVRYKRVVDFKLRKVRSQGHGNSETHRVRGSFYFGAAVNG